MEVVVKQEPSSVDTRGNIKFQVIAGVVATLSSLTQGVTLGLSAVILPQVQNRNGTETLYLTTDQGSWFASLYSVGCMSGALIGGFQSDIFGRKRSMMIDNIVVLIGAALIATAQSFHILLIGRFLGGYGLGSCITSLPAYLGEISHPSIRGTLTGVFGAVYYFGTFLLMTLSAIFSWRIVVVICMTVPLTTILGLSLCHESPVWLLRHGKKEEAIKSLIHFRGTEEIADLVLYEIQTNLDKEITSNGRNNIEVSWMDEIHFHLRELSSPTFWKPFLLILLLLPIIQNWAGMSFVTFYMVTFFQNMKIPLDPYIASSALCFLRFIFGVFSVRVLTAFSKKKTYLLVSFFMIGSNASLAVHQYLFEMGYFKVWGIEDHPFIRWFPLVSVGILFAAVSLGFASITRNLQGELLPANKRSFGCGIIGFCDGLSIFTLVKVSPTLSELLHFYGCFTLFTVDLIIGVILVYTFLPDTKGRSLEEIERFYFNPQNKGVTNSKQRVE